MLKTFTSSNSSKKIALALNLIALTAGLFFGGSTGYAYSRGNADSQFTQQFGVGGSPGNFEDSSENTRLQMHKLLQNNSTLSALTMKSFYNSDKDMTTARDSLRSNVEDIKSLFDKVYGTANTKDLEIYLNTYGDNLTSYALTLKQNDTTGIRKSVQDASVTQKKIAQLLAENDSDLSEDIIENMLTDHTQLLFEALDAHAKQDYETTYAKQKQAEESASKIADTLLHQ